MAEAARSRDELVGEPLVPRVFERLMAGQDSIRLRRDGLSRRVRFTVSEEADPATRAVCEIWMASDPGRLRADRHAWRGTTPSDTEEHFRLLTETSGDILSRNTTDSTCEYVSSAVTRVLGYEPEELLGVRFASMVHPNKGAARRSYGVAVARLAGVSEPVLARARAILASLESGSTLPGGRYATLRGRNRRGSVQLDLFAPQPTVEQGPSPVLETLAQVDPNRLTPLDALQLVIKLKAMLDESSE